MNTIIGMLVKRLISFINQYKFIKIYLHKDLNLITQKRIGSVYQLTNFQTKCISYLFFDSASRHNIFSSDLLIKSFAVTDYFKFTDITTLFYRFKI